MPDNEPHNYSFEEGDYIVSDRNLAEHLTTFNLTETDIESIPMGGKVLNIGSGIHRKFESELLKKRPDLLIISLDQTLGLITLDKGVSPSTQDYKVIDLNKGQYVIYRKETEDNIDQKFNHAEVISGEKAVRFDKERKSRATQFPGSVAANATSIPLSDESVDMAFDFWGPIGYLENLEDKQRYLAEIKRIMKPNAKVYISSLDKDEEKILDELGLKRLPIPNDEEEPWVITK